MFDHSRTRFHDKKAAQDFVCAVSKVFDRVKTVTLWSAKKSNKKDHKGLRFRSYSHLCLGEDNPNLIEDKMVENTNIYRKSNVFLILSSAVKTMSLRRMHTNDINLDFCHDVLHWLYK